jgi:TolB-like protein/DNA-binding winged helix-turn-helix (wHTH) protein
MKPNDHADQSIRFGPFELKLKSEELSRDGEPVKLPPQPFKVLALLTTKAGQLVTREELQQQVWGQDTFVDFDKGLNFCIKQIREALGDNAQAPQYIETLPRRGYRFIAPVERLVATALPEDAEAQCPASTEQEITLKMMAVGNPPHLLQWRTTAIALAVLLPLAFYGLWQRFTSQARPPAGKIMLAVLPFENLSADATQDYFSDGLTEEMITQLGRLRPQQLGVIARTTALTYKKAKKDIRQIGQELGVNYVLEGSVRREAGRVRITAQLIQVSDQTHLWAETYERGEGAMLQLQSEVADRVASSLVLELLPAPRSDSAASKTTQPEAYDAYLKGRYLVTKDTLPDLERSIPYFDQATEKDPNFAAAYAAAVEARVLLATWKNTPAGEVLPKAGADARQAIALDPALAEAYAALGSVNFRFEWNWPEAEKNIKRAVALNPSNPNHHLLYADYLVSRGEIEATVSEVKQAIKLDPVSLLTNGLSAYLYLRAHHYDDAIAQANRMLELEPKSPAAHDCLIRAYSYKGLYQEAREVILKQMRLNGAKPEEIAAFSRGNAKDAILNSYRQNPAKMKAAVQKGSKIPAHSFAATYTQLGDKDRAFEWLEKSFAAREPSFVFLKINPVYDSLHADPRFTDLSKRAGLIP